MSLGSIPAVVDLKLDSKGEVLSKIRSALYGNGFFVVVNHDVPPSIIKKTREVMQDFFNQGVGEKQRWRLTLDGPLTHGYVSPGGENSDVANSSLTGNDDLGSSGVRRDLMESFNYHCDVDGKNFPDVVGLQLKDAYGAFQAQMMVFLELVEEALGIPSGFLVSKHDWSKPHRTLMRCTHYPPLRDFGLQFDGDLEKAGKILRIGEHKDLGTLTLLATDDQAGLQVFVEEEQGYVNVPNIEGALIVNSGLCLSRLTNGRVRASVHRVVAIEDANTHPRFSVILFGNGNEEASLVPHIMFVDDKHPNQYTSDDGSSYTIGQYLACKLVQIFEKDARDRKGQCRFDD